MRSLQPDRRTPPRALASELAIESPYPETARFDRDRDVTPEDWQHWLDELAKAKLSAQTEQEASWTYYTALAANMLTVFPERRHELGIDEGTVMWTTLRDYSRTSLQKAGAVEAAFSAKDILQLFPGRQLEIGFTDAVRDELTTDLATRRRESDWNGYIWHLERMLYIWPDRIVDLQLDDTVAEAIKNEVQKWRDLPNWGGAAHRAAVFALAFPNRRSELKFGDPAWEQLRASFLMSGGVVNLRDVSMACSLAILAADEIRLTTARGLELVNLPPNEPVPRLPLRPSS